MKRVVYGLLAFAALALAKKENCPDLAKACDTICSATPNSGSACVSCSQEVSHCFAMVQTEQQTGLKPGQTELP